MTLQQLKKANEDFRALHSIKYHYDNVEPVCGYKGNHRYKKNISKSFGVNVSRWVCGCGKELTKRE